MIKHIPSYMLKHEKQVQTQDVDQLLTFGRYEETSDPGPRAKFKKEESTEVFNFFLKAIVNRTALSILRASRA